MAIAVIGGVLVSTLLTLFWCPRCSWCSSLASHEAHAGAVGGTHARVISDARRNRDGWRPNETNSTQRAKGKG
jgi:hypothetical protein